MVINEKFYDGSLIHSRFAYKYFRKNISPTGDIVSFVGPMYVNENLIDLEDSLTKDLIYSEEAINFCWEIPNLCALGAVAFQRLFNMGVANTLYGLIEKPIVVNGDDIIVLDTFMGNKGNEQQKGKASVSITFSKENVAIGHLGININAGKTAPEFAYSTKLTKEQQDEFIKKVEESFYSMTRDLWLATTKISI
jgi:hypothetical protein